jgi:hypothetical protein
MQPNRLDRITVNYTKDEIGSAIKKLHTEAYHLRRWALEATTEHVRDLHTKSYNLTLKRLDELNQDLINLALKEGKDA